MHGQTRALAVLAAVALVAAAAAAIAPAAAQETDQECHPSYDPCVPLADDVDCAGGDGDGPVFIDHPVSVIGPDDYGLDADGDGQGCEDEAGAPPAGPADDDEAPAAEPVEGAPTFTG